MCTLVNWPPCAARCPTVLQREASELRRIESLAQSPLLFDWKLPFKSEVSVKLIIKENENETGIGYWNRDIGWIHVEWLREHLS